MNHVEKAQQLFSQKFHCSQSVLAAFAQEFGITEEQALKIGACFGGGMCKGEVCGACTGALMALGLKFGQTRVGDTDTRLKVNDITVKYLDKFREVNGSYICKDLIGCDLSTAEGRKYARENNLFTEFCPKMVISAVKIAEEFLCLNNTDKYSEDKL